MSEKIVQTAGRQQLGEFAYAISWRIGVKMVSKLKENGVKNRIVLRAKKE